MLHRFASNNLKYCFLGELRITRENFLVIATEELLKSNSLINVLYASLNLYYFSADYSDDEVLSQTFTDTHIGDERYTAKIALHVSHIYILVNIHLKLIMSCFLFQGSLCQSQPTQILLQPP
jgi:hypothetical protein